MYICLCKAISDKHLKCAVECGQCETMDDLVTHFAVGTQCGRCLDCASQHLAQLLTAKRDQGAADSELVPSAA